MISFRPIVKENYSECLSLTLYDYQEKFVAPNAFSLVQAAYEDEYYPLAVYYLDMMIGFIMYDYDEELSGWSMSRFMIDKRYQGKGYGIKALSAFIDYFYVNHGQRDLYTCVDVSNEKSISLYESFGFEKMFLNEYYIADLKHVEMVMIKKVNS